MEHLLHMRIPLPASKGLQDLVQEPGLRKPTPQPLVLQWPVFCAASRKSC